MAMQPLAQHATSSGSAPHKSKGSMQRFMERAGNWLLEYWAHLITVVLGLLVFIAIAIPFLSYSGLDSIAKPLFFALHTVCAQIPSHSIYLFGHQLGLCERNFSIYTSMFLCSLLFLLTKKRLKGIPWWLWLLMLAPMALDGTTQLFGWRESTWLLRVITGTLFGWGNIWFAMPLMQRCMDDTSVPDYIQEYYARQARLQQKNQPRTAQPPAIQQTLFKHAPRAARRSKPLQLSREIKESKSLQVQQKVRKTNQYLTPEMLPPFEQLRAPDNT